MPSLLAQRPKDISKLLKVVVSQRDVDPGSQKKLDGHGTVDTDKDGQPGSDRNKADQVEQLGAASTEEEENQLPQLYLLKLLSETDARTLALTREVRKCAATLNLIVFYIDETLQLSVTKYLSNKYIL